MENSAENIIRINTLSELPEKFHCEVLNKFMKDKMIRHTVHYFTGNNLYIIKFKVIFEILAKQPFLKYILLLLQIKRFINIC